MSATETTKRKAFDIDEINTVNKEVVLVLDGQFCKALSEALDWYNGRFDSSAVKSLSWYLRDAAKILTEGIPVDRFPLIDAMRVVTDIEVAIDS